MCLSGGQTRPAWNQSSASWASGPRSRLTPQFPHPWTRGEKRRKKEKIKKKKKKGSLWVHFSKQKVGQSASAIRSTPNHRAGTVCCLWESSTGLPAAFWFFSTYWSWIMQTRNQSSKQSSIQLQISREVLKVQWLKVEKKKKKKKREKRKPLGWFPCSVPSLHTLQSHCNCNHCVSFLRREHLCASIHRKQSDIQQKISKRFHSNFHEFNSATCCPSVDSSPNNASSGGNFSTDRVTSELWGISKGNFALCYYYFLSSSTEPKHQQEREKKGTNLFTFTPHLHPSILTRHIFSSLFLGKNFGNGWRDLVDFFFPFCSVVLYFEMKGTNLERSSFLPRLSANNAGSIQIEIEGVNNWWKGNILKKGTSFTRKLVPFFMIAIRE